MLPVAHFYYARTVPQAGVPVAEVIGPDYSPEDLCQVISTPVLAPLTVVQYTGGVPGTSFLAAALNASVSISGATNYLVRDQFFQVTDQTDGSGNPLYYAHQLPPGISGVAVADSNGNAITAWTIANLTFSNGTFPVVLHSLSEGTVYRVQYYDAAGTYRQKLLSFQTLWQPSTGSTLPYQYGYTSSQLILPTTTTFHVRFVQQAGWNLLAPYNTLPNVPWFPRVRFAMNQVPMEYNQQVWSVATQYALAAWVRGTILDDHTVELERKNAWFVGGQFPDLLIYDVDWNLKYALAGSDNRHGFLPWKYHQITDFDPGRVRLRSEMALAPDDRVYGFYVYRELDLEYHGLDVNPYTNPVVNGATVSFYYKNDGVDPLTNIYYQVINSSGTIIKTNDGSHATGTNVPLGSILVGSNVGPDNFQVYDVRQRGGGLAPQYQNIPAAAGYFDIGWPLGGKPYPLEGAAVVYLPSTLLNTLARDYIENLVQQTLPISCYPVIRYYDPTSGQETV